MDPKDKDKRKRLLTALLAILIARVVAWIPWLRAPWLRALVCFALLELVYVVLHILIPGRQRMSPWLWLAVCLTYAGLLFSFGTWFPGYR